ncbi:NADP-dependent malic enzyme [Rhizobacter sp. Root1221]|uniref:NADP-dependent malic enzyme n=1 Tax=Rhizobacter sp. Root1221 TaxID=1736433 RepID=UPI0006F2FB10|nr:NADP-dependent malic enzyme [Rhizobacter sp. Root1221]KQW00809.1 malic enzyme [Rhizobacter sp. Root1221]
MADDLRDAALDYHRYPTPGKISVTPTKPMATQRDLALAYSPGVAEACLAIARDPLAAGQLTSRANLVAVITNGTAVLGLGNIGPLAGKPVMEGKGCLFKKFAGIDVFDIELDELDPDKLIDTIARMEPTFGGINLEDIKAPECFYIEQKLRERMKIPVFHDDQHGTAIVAAAAILNGLKHVGKDIGEVKLVASGAGAAALACLDLALSLGLKRENIWVTDGKGVVYIGRTAGMDDNKARYAQETNARTLADVMPGADIFLGLSAGGVLSPEMVKGMARDPLIFAMANPTPEIMPEDALAVRPDAVIGTGRSDYPNQINNVLCFPFIFRGALDVGATSINEAMKVATVHAIAGLAHAEVPDLVAKAYGAAGLRFGRDYLIPKPFDPRLIVAVAPAVARAAIDSGVATRPIADMDTYRATLARFVYHSGSVMQPVFDAAQKAPKRVVYAEGEDERVLRAVQIVVDERLAKPIVVGRAGVVAQRIQDFGLRLAPGRDFELVDPDTDARVPQAAQAYYQRTRRKGVTPLAAEATLRRNPTALAAMLVRHGDADALLCGVNGGYRAHLEVVADAIGLREGVETLAAMNMLMLPERTLFICDTYVNADPSPQQLTEITVLAADELRRFGIRPHVALVSHSCFGSEDTPSAQKMRRALALIRSLTPPFEVEGEMHGDAALSKETLDQVFPDSGLTREANLLVMPTLDAANITFNVLKASAGNGITVGPILLGLAKPAHVLTPTASVRRLVNMTALASVDAAAQWASHTATSMLSHVDAAR